MRSRILKASFFRNDQLCELEYEYRLLLQGLWCLADRSGRLEDRPRRIKPLVFPYNDVDVDDGLEALAMAGLLIRYSVEDRGYIQIEDFAKHQHINKKRS